MKIKVCKITPKTGFHIGTKEGWIEGTETFVHSDTIFSGICHNLSLLYGQSYLEEFLNLYGNSNFPLIISSIYPCINDNYFFPVPLNQLPEDEQKRKINFIKSDVLGEVLSGKSLDDIDTSVPNSCISTKDQHKYWESYTTPRVTISAISGTVTTEGEGYYQIGQVKYRKDEKNKISLFFLYQLSEDFPEDKFQAAVRLMADEGLGGDRSVGKGAFEYPEFEQIDIDIPKKADGYLTLSLYYPQKLPVQDADICYYDFVLRKGYMYSPFEQHEEKKPVRLFKEGSVFSINSFDNGKLIDVTPDNFTLHKVYRNGIAYALPCCLEVKTNE